MNIYNGYMDSNLPISMQDRFNSFSGGIPMWISNLAHVLVDIGVNQFLQECELLKRQSAKEIKTNWHYLMLGIKSLDKDELDTVIDVANRTRHKIVLLENKFKTHSENLEIARNNWYVSAESAKRQLHLCGEWAYGVERSRMLKILPSSPTRPMNPLKFKLTNFDYILESPNKFSKNSKCFIEKVDAIKKVMSSVYTAEGIPECIDVVEFSDAIDNLQRCQTQFDTILIEDQRIRNELNELHQRYVLDTDPLRKGLWLMSDAAKWALFCICRPELFNDSDSIVT